MDLSTIPLPKRPLSEIFARKEEKKTCIVQVKSSIEALRTKIQDFKNTHSDASSLVTTAKAASSQCIERSTSIAAPEETEEKSAEVQELLRLLLKKDEELLKQDEELLQQDKVILKNNEELLKKDEENLRRLESSLIDLVHLAQCNFLPILKDISNFEVLEKYLKFCISMDTRTQQELHAAPGTADFVASTNGSTCSTNVIKMSQFDKNMCKDTEDAVDIDISFKYRRTH